MRLWKDFGRVSEWHRALSWRVERIEEVDEEGNETKVCLVVLRDPETKTSCKKGPAHLWKCEKQETPTTEFINAPNGRPGKDEIDQAKTE